MSLSLAMLDRKNTERQGFSVLYILIGILLLLIGTFIYILDRPPDQIYFITALPFDISLYGTYPSLFGHMAQFLPHFFHVTAFILMSAGVMDCGKKGYALICIFWFILNAGFELGQKYSIQAANLVPAWFDRILIIENTRYYFLNGTYCHFDMVATLIGSILAYLFLVYHQSYWVHKS